MDTTTASVRAMYEAYPYPSGSAEIRTGFDARYVLSKAKLCGPADRTLQVLDAGCGRAIGLLGAAAMQPMVRFHGVDVNRRALEEATEAAKRHGLTNTEFSEVDLMTMDGLRVPEGGYDVVHSSGVIHHMTDPEAGLTKLVEVLAPHGVLVLMVYGKAGRQPIWNDAAWSIAPTKAT